MHLIIDWVTCWWVCKQRKWQSENKGS